MNHDESRAMSRLKYTLSKCEQDHTSNAVTRLKIYGEFWVQPRITVLEEVYALFFLVTSLKSQFHQHGWVR